MKFAVIEKDYKDSWNFSKDTIKWNLDQGLNLISEVSGDNFGTDATFLVFCEKDINVEVVEELVNICMQSTLVNENENDSDIIESISTAEDDNKAEDTITLKNGNVYMWVYSKH